MDEVLESLQDVVQATLEEAIETRPVEEGWGFVPRCVMVNEVHEFVFVSFKDLKRITLPICVVG